MKKITLLSILILSVLYLNFLLTIFRKSDHIETKQLIPSPQQFLPTPTPLYLPESKILLNNEYHVFQTFNNCGPASLSMALSYYGVNISQKVLGDELRPYQISNGDNDDKSVTLSELADKSEELGFISVHRPNGNIEIIKSFISQDIPVIVRTWTKPDEDIGHFRVIKGYNSNSSTLIQDDSLQGKNLEYSYSDFNVLWKKFNYEYLALVPKEKEKIIVQILGEELNENIAWKKTVEKSIEQLNLDPKDMYARFNLSVAYYKIGDYENSIEEFEKVESLLPFRTLWYQIEPILAYYELGNYEKVFSLTDKILNNGNRAFSELYIIRGNAYKKLGEPEKSKQEFEKAKFYKTKPQKN